MTAIEMEPGLPPGDDTLREHLGYSLDLVAMSLREIVEPGHMDQDREWYRRMSIIEVFWTQARLLIEFFTGRLASSTTAAAEHFTQGNVRYEFPSAQRLKQMRDDQIAHLNYARTTKLDEKLQPHDMYVTADALVRAVERFEQNLRSDAAEVWRDRICGRLQIDPNHVYVGPTLSACTTTSTSVAWAGLLGATGPAPPKVRKAPQGHASRALDDEVPDNGHD
ncbi:hypothetical protein [Bradyrhizobium jicamae]|uniref:hypothetical protein n=1 Tax=Bradyrhizobium jicamae TaxID=280332 RepID=UPI001BA54E14|nr:hypothetical protein [Bradyrhizobium jicamae]MBR0936675.1 hypothetical protein [Bradyrhizobium jicamae]